MLNNKALMLSIASAAALAAADDLNTLPNTYSLTAHIPGNDIYDGLKVENFALFRSKVGQYCPTQVGSACPNGTDMAFAGTLTPLSMVPGGQDSFVSSTGLLSTTVQHSHSIPSDAYWAYQGFTWVALPIDQPQPENCRSSDPVYNCDAPSGYFTWNLPSSYGGGVKACPNEYDNATVSLYAVVPAFNRTDCVDLVGLGTHNYTGPNPPVWAY